MIQRVKSKQKLSQKNQLFNLIKIKNLKNQLGKMKNKKQKQKKSKSQIMIKRKYKRKKRNKKLCKFRNKEQMIKKQLSKKKYKSLKIYLTRRKRRKKLRSKLVNSKSNPNKSSHHHSIQIIIWHQCKHRWLELLSFLPNKMPIKNKKKLRKGNKKMNELHKIFELN